MINTAITDAEKEWHASLPHPWRLVRGKWLISRFAERISDFKSGGAFLAAIAARQPAIPDVAERLKRENPRYKISFLDLEEAVGLPDHTQP
jgi:hypothetical protein